MSVFQLLVYSCVVANGLDGELMSKTCRWDTRELYVDDAHCEAAGLKSNGTPIHEFVIQMGATPRKIEGHKCQPISVLE